MRLFTAINFSSEVENQLFGIVNELKENSKSGNFSKKENLHLTLVFLGEVEESKISSVKSAMDSVIAAPFQLTASGFGKFRTNGGNIFWMGIEKSPVLLSVQKQLSDHLKTARFNLEDRAYSPHLTLGRKVVTSPDFNQSEFSSKLPTITAAVDRISLMKSERINGRLTYTELYSHYLQ